MKPHPIIYLIKRIVAAGCFALVCLPLSLSAAQVTLQWDWDSNTPYPEGFRLYQSLDPESFDSSIPAWEGSDTTCTVGGLTAGTTYYFVVRAFQSGQESADSNTVDYTPAATQDPPDEGGEEGGGTNPPDDGGASDPGDSGNTDDDDAGNDPSQGQGDTTPDQPSLLPVAPHDDAQDHRVGLTPLLAVAPYFHGNDDSHAYTRYQISTTDDTTQADFESYLVFDRSFARHLTHLRVPDLVLDPDTEYFWRVQFVDSRGGMSAWSEWSFFITIDRHTAGITEDGVLSEQQIDQWIVLDGQELQDAISAGLQGVNTDDPFNPQIAVHMVQGVGELVALRALESADLPVAVNQPEHLTGVVSFKLRLPDEGETAMVRVYFSQPAPRNARWYKYDPDQGWFVYPYATFSPDRRWVTLELEDGGSGDMDGVRNGLIVDPGGLGYSSQSSGSTDFVPMDVGGGGCFIATSIDADSGRTIPGRRVFLLVAGLGWLPFVAWRTVAATTEFTRHAIA